MFAVPNPYNTKRVITKTFPEIINYCIVILNATLQFCSLSDLVDFQVLTKKHTVEVDYYTYTMIGLFAEADIELAQNGYGAIKCNTDNVSKKNFVINR